MLVIMNGTARMRARGQTAAEARAEIVWRYFDLVERLYMSGARAFAFTLLVLYCVYVSKPLLLRYSSQKYSAYSYRMPVVW